jgi:hypothetical protein
MVSARNRLLAGALGVIVLAMLAPRLWRRVAEHPATTPARLSPETAGASWPSTNRAATASVPAGLEERLRSLSTELRVAHDAGTQRQRLAELRQALSAVPTNECAAAIRRMLDSKADAPTSQGFRIGGQGLLDEAPTLRTFLLDYLGRLDPAAAAAYARVILSSMDSPDEWAVALRNLARGDTSAEGRRLLEQKMGDLLRYEPWQQNPSVGYLEAFDGAVYLGGIHLVPTLTELVRKQDNAAVAHAAFLALDRLILNDAATTLAALQADPELMQGRELTRADYFARANVGDERQRTILENYLLDPRITAGELDTFAGVYPNANFMISPNLLTQTPTPDRAALTSRDAESLRIVQEWLADPRFAKLRPHLEKSKLRLEQFVRQPSGR